MGKTVITGSLLACLTLGATAAPAEARIEHVSRGEFNRVTNGMTAVAITNLFGIPGKMTSQGGGYQNRVFPGWKSGDGERYTVSIGFQIGPDSKWHVIGRAVYLPSDCYECQEAALRLGPAHAALGTPPDARAA
jgi:hypothetical protein